MLNVDGRKLFGKKTGCNRVFHVTQNHIYLCISLCVVALRGSFVSRYLYLLFFM